MYVSYIVLNSETIYSEWAKSKLRHTPKYIQLRRRIQKSTVKTLG